MRYKDNEFFDIIKNLLENDTIDSLKLYKHHYGSNRFEHCLSVAYHSYKICRFLHLDYRSVARAGILHDLFLYNCESKFTKPKFHIWKHPRIALKNAEKLCNLNNKERDIILKHMWPLTPIPPRYLESFIITFVDKYCAFVEWSNFCKYRIIYWYLSYFYRFYNKCWGG